MDKSLSATCRLYSDCLVPRRLSLEENVRAKQGGKETTAETVPFPWSLAVHHQSLASTLRKTKHLSRRLKQRCCERGPKSQLAKEMSGRGRRSREKRETKESEILVSQIFYNFFLFIFFFNYFTLYIYFSILFYPRHLPMTHEI